MGVAPANHELTLREDAQPPPDPAPAIERTLTQPVEPPATAVAGMPAAIGKYEVRRELGRGSCGVVYLGFDPFVQRDVAIKVALQAVAAGASTTRPDHSHFFVEARAAGMLQHPHIVSLFDAGVEGELSYIVMEYVDGETLREYTRKGGKRLPTDQVVDTVFKCSKALDFAHRKGVLHRDIKPSNIMLGRDGVVKIMDFSVAELTQHAASGRRSLVGSPLYMSPEQVRREPPLPQSDLYALGAVMYELLAGEPPFWSEDIGQLFELIEQGAVPALAERRPDLPPELCTIVQRLLHKDPARRFASGQELAAALSRVYDSLRLTGERLTRRENRDSLRALAFFNDFADSEIDEILNVSSMLSYPRGATIIQEGELDNTFYIIALGSVEVRKGKRLLQVLGKGDCFGEIGFLMSTKRTASVVAQTPVLVLKVNATEMQLVSRDCQLRYYKVFAENLIYRLALTSAQLAAASADGARKR
ncbi:MAG TPA: serine/threonine-protein kinase [Nevskiales bacterium]|nr:serine/threonine-protein kinase [Nevskiales bacterium]